MQQGELADLPHDMRDYKRMAARYGLPGPPVSCALFFTVDLAHVLYISQQRSLINA